jgi:cation-transporting P-type ATPase F
MKISLEQQWHHLVADEVVNRLETSADRGLDDSEVKLRQQEFGPNALAVSKSKNPLLLFVQQFNQPLVYILLAATVVTLFLREWIDAGVIFGVVLVNAVIGFVQESKAIKAIESLSRTMTSTATVLRGGARRQIPLLNWFRGILFCSIPGTRCRLIYGCSPLRNCRWMSRP